MYKLTSIAFLLVFCAFSAKAQHSTTIRPASLGMSFILNDYETAKKIRTTSLSTVQRDNAWAPLSRQSPGLGINYFVGLTPYIDFAGTLAGSFVKYQLKDQAASNSTSFLLEGDASANIKLLPEEFTVNPYAIAGIGVSLYRNTYGAFIPLGGGVKINLFNESDIFINFQYRVPVVKDKSEYHFVTSIGISGLLGNK